MCAIFKSVVFLFFSIVSVSCAPCIENDISAEVAKNAVSAVADRALEVIDKKNVSQKEVSNVFIDLLNKNFALTLMANYVLGRSNREQLKKLSRLEEFYKCFANMLVCFYSSKFAEFRTAKFSIYSAVERQKGIFLVKSKISINGKPDILADWLLRIVDGKLKIYDVSIEGLSVRQTKKDEITGAIQQKGMGRFMDEFKKDFFILFN